MSKLDFFKFRKKEFRFEGLTPHPAAAWFLSTREPGNISLDSVGVKSKGLVAKAL